GEQGLRYRVSRMAAVFRSAPRRDSRSMPLLPPRRKPLRNTRQSFFLSKSLRLSLRLCGGRPRTAIIDTSTMRPYPALVLFDIAGTLVRRAGPHHREALVQGIRRVTGLDTATEGIPVQGMLDPDIVRVMMRLVGAKPRAIAAAMPAVLAAAERYYLRVCP